ncbi:MAG: TonB-dependent receptor [Melioribacteraceae bacterium]|nr:TonB-dependent receptor [Melioribacteraceae bacterium]
MVFKFLFRTTAIFFLLLFNIYGQSGNVIGVVKDAATGDLLPGANVFIVGTSSGAATDIDGNFRISNVDVGSYILEVKYVGYKEKRDSITIVEDRSVFVEFELELDAFETEEVTVSAQASGQIAAINQQLNSNTIVNVISEEKIQELPDANAAEAIGRLSGVAIQRQGGEATKIVLRGLSSQYTAITVDGVRIPATDADERGVDLSMISQGSLAGIELYKALTSDKDADAIAGSVNLVTKKAPTTRRLRFEGEGIYSGLDNSFNQYAISLKYGERFFDNLLGVQLTGNLEKRNRSNENTRISYETEIEGGTDYRILNFDLNYSNEIRNRNGVSLLLDFNTPDNGTIKLNTIFNSTSRDRTNYQRNYPGVGGPNVSVSANTIETSINSFNTQLTGENFLFGLDATWGLSYAQSLSETPFNYRLDFIEATEIQYDSEGNPTYVQGMRPIPEELWRGPAEAYIPFAVNNFDKAFMNWGRFRSSNNNQKEKTIYLNLSKNFTFGKYLDVEIKAGGKYRSLDRFRESFAQSAPYYNVSLPQYTVLSDGSIGLKDWANSSFNDLLFESNRVVLSNFLGGNGDSRNILDQYNLNPLLNADLVREWYEFNKDGREDPGGEKKEYDISASQFLDYYDLTENVGAGYLMTTVKIGKVVTLLAGIRVENENNSYKSRFAKAALSSFYTPGTIFDTSSTFNETIWLPNFQVNITPLDFLNIRLAAYKALARPGFNKRLLKYRSSTGRPANVNLGNPNLRAAKAWNFEMSTSVYSNTIGLLTISGYYKVIEDMIHTTNGIEIRTSDETDIAKELGITWDIPFKWYGLTYPYNSNRDTKVWGFELDHQINMFFLPGYLSNFVLAYNVSINRSETYLYQTRVEKISDSFPPKYATVLVEEKTKLPGQSELFGNVAIGYDIGGFSARVSVFFQEPYTYQFDSDGRAERYQNSFSRWDLLIKQQITDTFALLLKVNNFTDYYEGNTYKNNIYGWELPLYTQRYGPTANLVLRVDL